MSGAGAHQLREHNVGVEENGIPYSSISGGFRAGRRGGIGRESAPRASKRRWMASARFGASAVTPTEPPRLGEWNADRAAIRKQRDDFIIGHTRVDDARVGLKNSVHATLRESLSDTPG